MAEVKKEESGEKTLKELFDKARDFISTKTVVGDPVKVGDVTIIPLVDVTFGVGAHSSTGGVGAKMSPNSLIVVTGGTVQLVNVKSQDSVNKLIDMVPGILAKFNLDGIFKKKGDKDSEDDVSDGV